MGVLIDIEDRFEDLKGSSEMEEGFRGWASRRPALAQFDGPDEMIAFLREQKGTYDDRNQVVWAICLEARKEAAKRQRPDGKSRQTAGKKRMQSRVASDLLIGLFVPALWRILEEANQPDLLDPNEVEAEILLGFWEAARTRRNSLKLSGALINAGRRRVLTALRAAKKQRLQLPFDEKQILAEEQALVSLQAEWSDPWVLVCWAQLGGVVDEIEAELIFWTRLHDRPLKEIAPVFDLTYEAARYRRSQAERRLRDWLTESGDEFPPTDPETAEKVLALAHKPPPAHARVDARVSVTRAENRLTRADFAPVCLTKEG